MTKFRLRNLTCFFILLFINCTRSNSQGYLNGDFESVDARKHAIGWGYINDKVNGCSIRLDSTVKYHGQYSIFIEKASNSGPFAGVSYRINKTFPGTSLMLKGYIKTENVKSGYAGLWLRIDGKYQSLQLNNMSKDGIIGSKNWTEYSVEVPFDAEKVTSINFGALLVGEGKMWVDNLNLYMNGEPLQNLQGKEISLDNVERDTAFIKSSKIDSIKTNSQMTAKLEVLGRLWGFLKYHSAVVADGQVNMDAELFRVLPSIIKSNNNNETSDLLEAWVDKFRPLESYKIQKKDFTDIKSRNSNYKALFENPMLKTTLAVKLKFILNNSNIQNNYYVSLKPNGNPEFKENSYRTFKYPDVGYRLLALYRYWNIIQYFYPNRYLIGQEWDAALPQFIPQFINAPDELNYTLTALQLITKIRDTHAVINGNASLEQFKGLKSAPFQADFISEDLVVTGFYSDSNNVKARIHKGDIIKKINGETVASLIKKYLPISPASNRVTQLRFIARNYLLRSNAAQFDLEIQSDHSTQISLNSNLGLHSLNEGDSRYQTNSYYFIKNNIGYLFPGRYKNSDLQNIEDLFSNTRGMIIDMRCYPSDFMPFSFGQYLKAEASPFAKFSHGSIKNPGDFIIGSPIVNGGTLERHYDKKVIVIVNESTLSQAEYTTMAFQSSPNVKVLGSETAGADGDISNIVLPGNIQTLISGLGVFYPDGIETQRKGVKIDYLIKPTIHGISIGKDELIEEAERRILRK